MRKNLKRSRKNGAMILGSLGAALLLVTGCSPKAAKAVSDKGSAMLGKQAPAWSWESYPLVSKMRLGMMPCQLQPKSVIAVHSPMQGTLRVYLTSPQTNLPAGFLWAEFEPELFAAEAKALKEAEQKLTEREKLQNEIELPQKKLQLERQIEEAQRQVSMLRMLSTNKELADLAFNVGPTGNNPLRPDSLHKSELELRLLLQSMEYLTSTNFTAMGVDLGSVRSELDRRKLEFEKRQNQARFKMPFEGRLTVTLPLTEGVTEYPVSAAQELGVVRDLSSIRLRVPVSNVSWMNLPGEKLSAVLRLPNGEALTADFAFQKLEKVQNREESVYYFQLPDEQATVAARMIGMDVSCEIWTELDKPVRVVPKLDLVLHHPDAFTLRNWSFGVQSAFPGATLSVEGQTELGIIPPEVVKVSSAK